MENNVMEINQNKIVLTNGEVMNLVQTTVTEEGKQISSPEKVAFDRLKSALTNTGKPFYWMYRVQKKILELHKEIEVDRVAFAKQFCDKNEDSSLKFMEDKPNQLSFLGEGFVNFNKAFTELILTENVLPIDRIKISAELIEKMNSTPENIVTIDDLILLEKIIEFVE